MLLFALPQNINFFFCILKYTYKRNRGSKSKVNVKYIYRDILLCLVPLIWRMFKLLCRSSPDVLYFDSGGRKYYYLVPCSLTVATAQSCKWKVKYIFALLAFCTKWEEMRVFAYVITADTSLDPDRVCVWLTRLWNWSCTCENYQLIGPFRNCKKGGRRRSDGGPVTKLTQNLKKWRWF